MQSKLDFSETIRRLNLSRICDLTFLFTFQLWPKLRRHWKGLAANRYIEDSCPRSLPAVLVRRGMPPGEIPSRRWLVQQLGTPDMGRSSHAIPTSHRTPLCRQHRLTTYLGDWTWFATLPRRLTHDPSRRRISRCMFNLFNLMRLSAAISYFHSTPGRLWSLLGDSSWTTTWH